MSCLRRNSIRSFMTIAQKYGILYVADEVQSGMGRTGKMFAMEHFGVAPDIMALAKGIASGLPLGSHGGLGGNHGLGSGLSCLDLRWQSDFLPGGAGHHRTAGTKASWRMPPSAENN